MDEVTQHTKRANYQAAILRRSLQAVINAPSPIGHGWSASDGESQLTVQWMTVDVAPPPPEFSEEIYLQPPIHTPLTPVPHSILLSHVCVSN